MKKEFKEVLDRHLRSKVLKEYIFNFTDEYYTDEYISHNILDIIISSDLNIITKLNDLKICRDIIKYPTIIDKINRCIETIEIGLKHYNQIGLFELTYNYIDDDNLPTYMTYIKSDNTATIEKFMKETEFEDYKPYYISIDKYILNNESHEYEVFCSYVMNKEAEIVSICFVDNFYVMLYNELNIYTPFKPGDIVEVQESQYNKKFRYMIVRNASPNDINNCCSLQGLKIENGKFIIGSVSHYKMHPGEVLAFKIPDLNSIDLFEGELPEEEKILKTLSDIIKEIPEENKRLIYNILDSDQLSNEMKIEFLKVLKC